MKWLITKNYNKWSPNVAMVDITKNYKECSPNVAKGWSSKFVTAHKNSCKFSSKQLQYFIEMVFLTTALI